MIDVGNPVMLAGIALLLTAATFAMALWRMRRVELARLRGDHRIHVIVVRTRASLKPQGNGVSFPPRAERNAHNG